jgi:hypothetical protein
MSQLKGGTTGQILSKTSATDMAFTWITNDVGDITAVTAGTGISGGGTSGAVTVTNSMATAITTAGDLIKGTGSGTFDRLGIGSTGQVLTVASGAPSWATPAGGASGMSFIARTTFSNVASQAFDGVFTSTYKNYLVVIENLYATTSADDLQLQFRYAGPTTEATAYYGSSINAAYNSTSVSNTGSNGATQFTVSPDTGGTGNTGAGFFYVTRVGNSSDKPAFLGQYAESTAATSSSFSGVLAVARIYTGFLLKTSSSNITGTVSIYGLAAS